MPLVPSRIARTLNSWAPNGSLVKDADPGPPSEPVQKASSKWRVASLVGEGPRRKEGRGMRSVALQAIALNLQPFRHGGNYKGFAQEPKPKVSAAPESPVTGLQFEKRDVQEVDASTVQSPTNRNVHFDTDRSRRHSLGGCPVQSICPNAFVHCASALFLATGGSPQSIGHLRKWNSQTCLAPACHPEFREAGGPALRRKLSLPDLGRKERSQIDLLRPPDLQQSTTISFWIDDKDKVKVFSRGRTMLYIPGLPQSMIQGQSELLTLGPQLLAQELTLLARELLLAVGTSELLTYVVKPRMARVDSCPNLHRLLQFYERLSCLVITEILANQAANERAQTIALFIEMASQCERLQNWQSCLTLLSGIRSPPVVRLTDTWFHLRVDFPDHFQLFERLLLVGCGPEPFLLQHHRQVEPSATPHSMAAVSYFGDIVSRARSLPTDQHLISPRAPWKEPPSLAKWVAEQTAITSLTSEWEEYQSAPSGNHASRYLKAFALGKNLFCPIEKIPRNSRSPTLKDGSEVVPADDDSAQQRLSLTQMFDDPEALPFASSQVQCCALQPSSLPQIRQRVEGILRSAQAAARAYDIQTDPACRRYWLDQRYSSKSSCMKRSLLLERAVDGKTKPKGIVV